MKQKNYFAASFWTALSGLLLFLILWTGHAVLFIPTPTDGKPGILYSTETRDDLQLGYTQAINSARSSILLMIYSLTDRKIQQALRSKAEQGIDVTVICDGNASRGISKKLGPKVKIYLRKGQGLMHQKILIIDEKKIWIGSANMTPSSLKNHGNLVVGFNSPKLAHVIHTKAEMMTREGLIEKIPAQEINIGGQQVELWFFPDNPDGAEKIRSMIRTAQKSIKVAMFTWTRLDLAHEIVEAKKRGVAIEIVMDRNSSRATNAKVVKFFAESGLPSRVNQGSGLLHHKFILIDDKTLINGSPNWTLSAFTKNDECFVILHELTDSQQKFLKKLWNQIILDSFYL